MAGSPGRRGPRTATTHAATSRNPRLSLKVAAPHNTTLDVVLGRAASLLNLKDAVANLCPGLPSQQLELSLNGQALEGDSVTLKELGIFDGATLTCRHVPPTDHLPLPSQELFPGITPCRITSSFNPNYAPTSPWPLRRDTTPVLHPNWQRCGSIKDGYVSEPLPQSHPAARRPVLLSSPSFGAGKMQSAEKAFLRNRVEAVRERLAVDEVRRSRRRTRRQLVLTPPPSAPSSIPSSVSSRLSEAPSLNNMDCFPPSPGGTPKGSRCVHCPSRLPLVSYNECTCGALLCTNHIDIHQCVPPKPSASSWSAKNLYARTFLHKLNIHQPDINLTNFHRT